MVSSKAIMLALIGLVILVFARAGGIAVYINSSVEIPPLAYYDGKALRPVHVAYVGEWDRAFWYEANATVNIPTWSFKKAVIYLPREALGARAPPNFKRGVLRVYINNTVVELVEAPPEVIATYSYLKPGEEIKASKAKATWIKPPVGRGPAERDKEQNGRDATDKFSSALQASQASSVVFPDGAFIYKQFNGLVNSNSERCLEVLRTDSYSPPDNPTVASVGYNATYVWRTAWYVFTSSLSSGTVAGKGVIKVWEVDPATLNKKYLLGAWSVDLRNGYVTFTTSISLNWPDKFIGLELCFAPSVSATYTVGANATLGFRKNAISIAMGSYSLGVVPVDRTQYVGGVLYYQVLRPPIRNIIFGPFTLADGYYGQTLNLDMTVYVPWSTSQCPTLVVTTYVGDLAHMQIDSISFTASGYGNGACRYEVRRTVTLSSSAIGFWYDEARARDKAVVIRVSFNYDVSEVVIYRVDISGYRFAENYIDKNVNSWLTLVLRGYYSQTLRACTMARLPQVNYTVVLANIETYSAAAGTRPADFLAVNVGAPSGYKIQSVEFRIRPSAAFAPPVNVYVKGTKFEEPWWLTWTFRIAQAIKTVLDFLGLIPGPLSWFIDRVFDLRGLLYPDLTITQTADYVAVTWRAGVYDSYYQAAFEIGVANVDRVLEATNVYVSNSAYLCMYAPISSQMPKLDTNAPFDTQYLRHWVYGIRVTRDIPFIVDAAG